MGVPNFYITIAASKNSAELLQEMYMQDSKYFDVFNCAILEFLPDNRAVVGIESVIENFLVANSLIFKLLNEVSKNTNDLDIMTLDTKKHWDFQNCRDFVVFMYDVWHNKIEYVYEQFGTIVISSKRYWKTRSRLFKKYYKKTL